MLSIPNSIYDYLLFYECASSDWISGTQKLQVAQNNPGGLINCINWGVSGTTAAHDSGGNTKCGITHSTWSSWFPKNKNRFGLTGTSDVNTMDKRGWLYFIQDSWSKGHGNAANVACAIVLFQAQWGGWSNPGSCLQKLIAEGKKQNPSYNFASSGSVYAKMADATKAFKNPMDAFQIIRNAHQQYLYDISAPGKSNHANRVGWMRREIAPFQDDGLYIESGVGALIKESNKNLTIDQWKALCNELKGKGNYVKLCSWGNMPTNPEKFDIDVSLLLKPEEASGNGAFTGSVDDGSPYVPRFSSSMRTDPHLSASKEVELKKGTLLGSEFKVK